MARISYWMAFFLVLPLWIRKMIVKQLWKQNMSLYIKVVLISERVWKRKITSYDTYKTIRRNFAIEILRGRMREEGRGKWLEQI